MKILFLVLIGALSSVTAQITISLPDVISPAGEEVHIPLNVSGFYNIGALSLAIEYDTSSVSYIESLNVPAGILINRSGNTIYFAYASLTPLNTGSGVLLTLVFNHIRGNTDLEFTEECETANAAGEVANAVYNSGRILDPETQRSEVGDRVWIDMNKNGLQDINEPGLQWVTVELFDCNGRWLEYTLTDSAGYYYFGDLDEGEYYLQFTLIDNNSSYTFTTNKAGENEFIDSDAEAINDSTAVTSCITVLPGELLKHYDAGVYLKASDIPNEYHLAQNYPNPFNPVTVISFTIPLREEVTLTVYNILGERVKVLLNEVMEAGVHSIEFNAEGLKSSVYFYSLSTPGAFLAGKMVLTR